MRGEVSGRVVKIFAALFDKFIVYKLYWSLKFDDEEGLLNN